MLIVKIVSTVLSISILLGGLLVLLRSQKKIENILFFFVCLFSALWGYTFVNIEAVHTLRAATFLNAASYVLGGLLMLAVTAFTFVFPIQKNRKSFYIYCLVLFPVILLSATPLLAGNVTSDASGNFSFTYGTLTALYVFVMFVGVLLIGNNLLFRRKNHTAIQKEQSTLVATGFIISFIIGVGLSTLLPLIVPQTQLDDLSPFALVFLSVFSGYAIVKRGLFDFRAVLVRALTYVLTTSIVVGGYVVFAFLLKRFIFPQSQIDKGQFASNILLTVVLVVTYPTLKRLFDKFTNRIFYRDAYDPQLFLDELNKTLVSNLEIEKLLSGSARIIESNLKAQYCSFYVGDTEYFDSRLIGDYDSKLTSKDIGQIQKLLLKVREKTFFVEDEALTEEKLALTKLFKSNGIEIFVRLTTSVKDSTQDVGYLLIGPKKSGNLYNKQDLRILEIISNEVVIAIDNALRFEEIDQFNVTLQKKITDATKELKKTNDKLKALDEAKDEFISMASHQLRTPLTSVKGYLSMLGEGDAGKLNETQMKFIDQAFVSSQRMVYLISDLLNVSRLKTGKFIIESQPVYLPDLIESEIAQLIETVKSRGLTMQFDKPKDFPTLMLDETKIRQVVMNFTDNAIYYTPAGGSVVLTLQQAGDSVEFAVQDDGMGVAKAEQPHLFTKFYRAGNARKARPDGTGLGLFMAKKVIVASGGSLIFKSTEGKGSTFGFRFNASKNKAP